VAGAKEEHLITSNMREPLMVAVDSNCAAWEVLERKYKAAFKKNHTNASTRQGSHTMVSADLALQKALASGIMKMPKSVITTMTPGPE